MTVQGAEQVLQYLERYVHRTAFANSRLVRIKDCRVTFRYKVRRPRQWKTMTLCAVEFIRRFLQHVLPRVLTIVAILEGIRRGTSPPVASLMAVPKYVGNSACPSNL